MVSIIITKWQPYREIGQVHLCTNIIKTMVTSMWFLVLFSVNKGFVRCSKCSDHCCNILQFGIKVELYRNFEVNVKGKDSY